MTGPQDSTPEPHRPSENDRSDPPRLTRLDSESSSSKIERVFPIRVALSSTKQASQNVDESPPSAPLQAPGVDRGVDVDVFVPPGDSLQPADTREESRKPSVPLVSTLPPSEDSSSSNRRYVTNRSEFITGLSATPSAAPVEGQKIYRCEDEPIHIPGAIQRFGALIAMRETDGLYLVRIISDNSHSVVGIHPEALFDLRCFTDLLVSNDKNEFLLRARALAANLSARDSPDVFQISLTSLRGAPIPLYCAMHLSTESDLIICEFELEQDFSNPTSPSNHGVPDEPIQVMEHQATAEERLLSTTIRSKPLHALQMVRQGSRPLAAMDLFQILSEIQAQLGATTELPELLDQVVGLVYELTGFHRVMIYQFDENAAGSVVSELVNPQASTDLYRGLHFPASDIPKQARDLYLVNKIRVLYNRDQEPSRLICRTFDDAKTPLNLKHSYLRAMSPIHIRYLKNMGVQASMSISLTVNQQLWGLVSCHNYGSQSGMRISLPMREICRGLGNIASSNIEKLLYTYRIKARRPLAKAPPKGSPFAYITSSSTDLRNMFGADFGFLVIKGEARTIGKLTAYSECIALLQYIRSRGMTTIFSTHQIGKDCPDLGYPLALLAGMLVIPLSMTGSEFLVFLRKGKEKEINWAGNPYLKDGATRGSYLEPRNSFKRWSESVKGTSRAWTEDEVESANVLTTIYVRFIEVWRQNEAIVQRNRMTRILVRNAGHEVRTPLNSIINYLESALEEELDERARLHLTKSLEASKSLVFVVNDLLNLTEAEDGVYATYEDDVDLRSMVAEVIRAFQRESDRKGLEVGFQDDAAVPRIVRCNPDGLRQVLSNLLANAIQYSNQGHIYIGLYHIEDAEGSPSIRVSFQDEGVGLSELQLDSIFQNFEQILEDDDAKSSSDNAKGDLEIGLGLATAARFARLNNGQIFMSSEGQGRGTTVSITIPFRNVTAGTSSISDPLQMTTESLLSSGKQTSPGTDISETLLPPMHITNMPSATASPASAPSPLVQRATSPYIVVSTKGHYPFPVIAAVDETLKLNVLIAEDNPLNSRLLEMRLTKRGHEVEIAVDGQACIDAFKKNPEKFDVILMDIQMPILDGIQATKLIRDYEQSPSAQIDPNHKIPAYGRIPIVAVSASLFEQRVGDYIDAGFDGWILKPIDFKRLEALLTAVRDEGTRGKLLYGSVRWAEGGWFRMRTNDPLIL